MLVTGSDDGIYSLSGLSDPEGAVRQVCETDQVYRLERFDGHEGLFAATASGLFHSTDGSQWASLGVPAGDVYAVAASPDGSRLYAGTRPAHVFVAAVDSGLPSEKREWTALDGFRDLEARTDWGIDRHEGIAQVRALRTHPDRPDRLVVGIEVGGVYVSDDAGDSWTARCIDGFDAPHTDDIHHLAMPTGDTLVASTGSGLYRSSDCGRDWHRLDTDQPQRYFREAHLAGDTIYAGGAPRHPSTWDDETDHGLFACRNGHHLEPEPTSRPDEVVVGWCSIEGTPLAVTHHGTLLRRSGDQWQAVGTVPAPDAIHGRCIPLATV